MVNEKIEEILKSFREIKDVLGAAIYDKSGNLLSDDLPNASYYDIVADMISLCINIRQGKNIKNGKNRFKQAIIEYDDNLIILKPVDDYIYAIVSTKYITFTEYSSDFNENLRLKKPKI